MNHIIKTKDMMATIFAKDFNELYSAFAAVMDYDVQNKENSSFFFIPTSDKNASCTTMKMTDTYFFMRLPIALLKDFEGCEGAITPSENVIYYAVPLTRNSQNPNESVYMFCALNNDTGVANSKLPENEIYRISINNRAAMNEIADKYYSK